MKSPIIYYGGKDSMIKDILPLIPAHDTYTETYFGGGALYWAKQPVKNETINDKLDYVVNFYQQLKTNFPALKKLIDATCFSRTLHVKALYMLRHKSIVSKVNLAWAFWLCANFSYSNKIGGGIKFSNNITVCPPDTLTNFKRRFTEVLVSRIEHAHIENNDAITVQLSRNVATAFHYIDPPYINADQGHYKGYTEKNFEAQLDACEKLKGKFILSNYNSRLLSHYVKKNGWWQKELRYNNKPMRKEGREKIEVLVANFIPATQHELFHHQNAAEYAE